MSHWQVPWCSGRISAKISEGAGYTYLVYGVFSIGGSLVWGKLYDNKRWGWRYVVAVHVVLLPIVYIIHAGANFFFVSVRLMSCVEPTHLLQIASASAAPSDGDMVCARSWSSNQRPFICNADPGSDVLMLAAANECACIGVVKTNCEIAKWETRYPVRCGRHPQRPRIKVKP